MFSLTRRTKLKKRGCSLSLTSIRVFERFFFGCETCHPLICFGSPLGSLWLLFNIKHVLFGIKDGFHLEVTSFLFSKVTILGCRLWTKSGWAVTVRITEPPSWIIWRGVGGGQRSFPTPTESGFVLPLAKLNDPSWVSSRRWVVSQ